MSIFICNKCGKQFDSDYVEMHEPLEGVFYCDECYKEEGTENEIKKSIPEMLHEIAGNILDNDYFFFFYSKDGNTDKNSAGYIESRECKYGEYMEARFKDILTSMLDKLSFQEDCHDEAMKRLLELCNDIFKEECKTYFEFEEWDYEEGEDD